MGDAPTESSALSPAPYDEDDEHLVTGFGDDGDDDAVPVTGSAPSNAYEKRRAQNAIFESWLTSAAGQEALTPKTKDGKPKEADEDDQSVQSLLSQQQRGSRIVKNPREYQIELFERAKHENTIAVLDTGSGKTLIAVLLLRWTIDNEIERRAQGHAFKISFFLVPSVNLAYQQFSVLECNLDHRVARLCGSDNTDRWDRKRWITEFLQTKVIVCTAELLFQALCYGYLTMKQINLLIFDEAHHTKKNHSYARIIKDFYLGEPREDRPRIFGMTASPIDAKVDVVQAASELETLLDSRIATTSDMSLTEAIKRPEEHVLIYDAPPQVQHDTALLTVIKQRYEHIEVFSKYLQRATEIAAHLGRWCADSYLVQSLSHEKLNRFDMLVGQGFRGRSRKKRVAELDAALKEIKQAIEMVQGSRGQLSAPITRADMSSKVYELTMYLKGQFENPSNHRAIIFVDRRHTARLLNALFKRVGTKHLKSHFLVGSNSIAADEDSFSFRQQVMTLLKFRKGELNCLFATAVAEEGLDVPDCNLIIRFDIYATMIQYVQSRGRARKGNSKFINMVERGNAIHKNTLQEVRYAEACMRAYCDQLPDDRKLTGNMDSLETLLERENNMETRVDPVSGAKLTYGNALSILAHFVTAIPTESHEPQHPTYIVSCRGGRYIAEVMLPGNSPLRSQVGKIHTKKSLARRSAAFDACVYLRQKNYLNENLLPVYQKKLPAMRNALLAVGMKKCHGYAMQIKPKLWAETRGSLPSELFVSILDFPDGLDRPHQPLAFLTRTPLPQFPAFPVYRLDGTLTSVVSASLHSPLSMDEPRFQRLSAFTFRMFRDVFSKTYEQDAAKLSYWLAPAAVVLPTDQRDLDAERSRDPVLALDWALLDEVYANDEYKWTPETPPQLLLHRFIVDPFDGSRKFISRGINTMLKPTDPVPGDAVKGKQDGGSILDYSVSLWKKSRQKMKWTELQPIVETELVTSRRNMLAPAEPREAPHKTKAYLCPEPLRISVIPPPVATSCFVWPVIIHRFESYLISMEGCAAFGIECSPELALAAFTKDSENQSENDSQARVNFQKGMGENYERLEFIGDTFLKTATTISTFTQNPNENEFEFHVRRMQMLCNKNLYNTALKLEIYKYIRSMSFSRRYWYPEGLKLLTGTGVIKGQEKEMYHDPRQHALGEKTIADVVEALIGAAYMTHNQPDTWKPQDWDGAVRAVTTMVDSDDHRIHSWEDYVASYEKPTYQVAEPSAVQQALAERAELEHSYKFQYPPLLWSAFLHPSMPYTYEKVPSYQRLEFLGDALLDQASISYLFYQYPDKDPQWLTEHKMAMVSNKFLGALCVNIGFHKHLRHQQAQLQGQITSYVTELLEAKRVAGSGRDYWTTVSDPPKCLPDIIESYVGAMFIDSGFNFGEVQRFFREHVEWYFQDMSIYDTYANNHPCTHLLNLLQTTFGCTDFRLLAKELPSRDGIERKDVVAAVMIHDHIVASCVGKSGRYARLRTANQALEKLDGLAPFEYRAMYGCQCELEPHEQLGHMDVGD